MKRLKKATIAAMAITVGITTTSVAAPYTVKPKDSFWTISNKYGVSLESILKENNATDNTIIYPGQVIQVPEKIKLNSSPSRGEIHREVPRTISYTIEEGDNLWTISEKYLISAENIIKINEGLTKDTIFKVGQVINLPLKEEVKKEDRVESKYGEYLNWFDEVEKLIPRGSDFKVIDFYTGKSYMARRSVGSYHADCETLTKEDTDIMKSIWGGFSWERRPAIIEYNGRRIACSVTFMPHAGNDSEKGGVNTSWRSGGYGPGINFDYIKGNGIDGHFDIHFVGSKRHMDGKQDPEHQKMIKIAAGIK